MKASYKKICLLFCGTIFNPKNDDVSTWLSKMPELGVIADISPFFVYGESTANVTPNIWIKLAGEIYKRYDEFDGFVILHDLDNLLFTASATSFLLQDLGKPVIFTGRQSDDKKVLFKESGIKANVINACQVATHDIAEVALMFGNRLLRANCARPNPVSQLNIFVSPDEGVLGQVDFSVRVLGRAKRRAVKKPKFYKNLNGNIEIIETSPLLDFDLLKKRIEKRDGLIIGLREKNMPDVISRLLKIASKNMPIVLYGNMDNLSDKENVVSISATAMTFETVVAKFSWALAQSKDVKYISTIMTQNVAGELS